jgi:CRISPR/Cas system CSM-associated protein Csm2 small subunit
LGEEIEGDPEAEPTGLLEDREEARRLLEEGRALLDDDLPKAEARIAEARRRAGREGEDLFQTLDRMLRHFDTDGAASVLDQLVKLLS